MVTSIISLHVITESPIILPNYLPFSQVHVLTRIINIFFYTLDVFLAFFTHVKLLSLFYFRFELHFLPSNLHVRSHDICFVNAFDPFIPAIILKIFKFTSSVLFATYILTDGSPRVLQLSLHLSKLITNG